MCTAFGPCEPLTCAARAPRVGTIASCGTLVAMADGQVAAPVADQDPSGSTRYRWGPLADINIADCNWRVAGAPSPTRTGNTTGVSTDVSWFSQLIDWLAVNLRTGLGRPGARAEEKGVLRTTRYERCAMGDDEQAEESKVSGSVQV